MRERRMIPCGDCLFYRENADHKWGTCHRNAPRAVFVSAREAAVHDTYWPPVPPDEACGDGQDKRIHTFGGYPMTKGDE